LAGATLGGRPLADWSMREALSQVMSAEGYRFVNEGFGYDSGVVGFNVADALPYMLGAGHPGLKAVVPEAAWTKSLKSYPRVSSHAVARSHSTTSFSPSSSTMAPSG